MYCRLTRNAIAASLTRSVGVRCCCNLCTCKHVYRVVYQYIVVVVGYCCSFALSFEQTIGSQSLLAQCTLMHVREKLLLTLYSFIWWVSLWASVCWTSVLHFRCRSLLLFCFAIHSTWNRVLLATSAAIELYVYVVPDVYRYYWADHNRCGSFERFRCCLLISLCVFVVLCVVHTSAMRASAVCLKRRLSLCNEIPILISIQFI